MATNLLPQHNKGSGPVFLRRYPPPGERGQSVCNICQNWSLNTAREEPETIAELRVDFFDVAESADAEQCIYCYVIYQALLACNASVQLDGYSLLTLSARRNSPFYVVWDDAVEGRECLEVYRSEDSACLLNGLGSANAIVQSPRATSLVDMAKRWLNECQQSHTLCQQVEGLPPRRLIRIGDTAHEDRLCLIEDISPDTKYGALSHCWGLNQFKTTKSTLGEMLHQIIWDHLPQTFKDAIDVVKALGLEYIWIDSLCIIQDDKSDWLTESANMGSIYERAEVTIAAATAADDSEGFLRPTRSRARVVSTEIDMFPFCGPTSSGVWARKTHDVRMKKVLDPLDLRAWTFQERLLPRRLFTYSSALVFECKTSCHCECGSGLKPDRLLSVRASTSGMSNRFNETDRAGLDSVSSDMENSEIYDLWYHQVVQPFQIRKLTQEKDRLPALAAIAAKFHRALLSDQYLAGLWRYDLERGLQWVSDAATCLRSTASYRAPSWSWASIEGPITFGNLGRPDSDAHLALIWRLTIHSVWCSTSKTNPFGEVSSGALILTGLVKPCLLLINVESDRNWRSSLVLEGVKDPPLLGDHDIVDTALIETTPDDSEDGTATTVLRAPPGHTMQNIRGPVLALLTWEKQERTSELRRPTLTERGFLVLGRVSAQKEVYQRLGHYSTVNGAVPGNAAWFGDDLKQKKLTII